MHRLLPFSIVSLVCLALIVGCTISLAQDNQPPERLDRIDRLGEVMGSVDGGVDKMLGDTPLLNKPLDVTIPGTVIISNKADIRPRKPLLVGFRHSVIDWLDFGLYFVICLK